MKSLTLSKKEHTILFLLSSFLILCYFFVGFFCHPSGDDFSYAVLGKSNDFLDAVLNERERWNGRYISNFFVLFSPLNWGGILGYKLASLALICCIILGTSFVFKMILGNYNILCSLVSTLITFSNMPDITEGIYWYTGAWTYIPGGLLFLMSSSILVRYWKNLKALHYFIIFLLFLIASGFNEIIPLLGIFVFLVLISTNIKEIRFVIFFIFFAVLLLYIISAPGNSVRANYFPNKHQIINSLFMSSAYTARFIGEWLLNPALFFWGVIILKIDFKTDYLDKLTFFKKPLFALLALIIPTFICCFGPIWSTGLLGQYRTANLACYIFLLTYTLIVAANKDFLKQKIKLNTLFKYSCLVLIIFLIMWKNQFFMFKELLNGDISQFNQDMYKRYDVIKNCKESDCYVPTIENNSKTLFVYPLDSNPNNWKNTCYQLYFNSGKIIKGADPSKSKKDKI